MIVLAAAAHVLPGVVLVVSKFRRPETDDSRATGSFLI